MGGGKNGLLGELYFPGNPALTQASFGHSGIMGGAVFYRQ